MHDKPEPLLSVQQTAEKLNLSTRTVYRLIEDGELPALKVGGSVRVDA